MNLKDNYERFFGKIDSKKEEIPFQLNEEQKKRFNNLSTSMAHKYPNAPLTIKEGYVYVGYKKWESVEKFFSRTSLNIQESIRAFSVSGKKGLL